MTYIKLRVVSNHSKSEFRPDGARNAFLKSLITQNKSFICTLGSKKKTIKSGNSDCYLDDCLFLPSKWKRVSFIQNRRFSSQPLM